MFKHLLITRFNLKNPDWKSDKQNVDVLTDQWHDDRFSIFRDFCFSTVKAQTNQNFEWLVFFDISSSEKYREIIRQLEAEFLLFKPRFVDGMDEFLPSIRSYASTLEEDFLITSRLDNDDSLSVHYIAEVQKNFDRQPFMAIDYVDGYTVQIQPQLKIGKRLDQYNPFISLIENNKNARTVWSVERHSHWKREKNLKQIRNERIWTSVIHAANKVNHFGGYDEIDIDAFLDDFKIADHWKKKIKNDLVPIEEWYDESKRSKRRQQWNFYFKNLKKNLGVYNFK